MRRIISFVLIICMLSIVGVSAQIHSDSVYGNVPLSPDTINELEKHVSLSKDGSLYLEVEQAEKSGHNKTELTKMQDILNMMNEKIANDEISIGQSKNVEKVEKTGEIQPENWSPTPIVEHEQVYLTLSKSETEILRDDLDARGFSDIEDFLITAGLTTSGILLSSFFGAPLVITNSIAVGGVFFAATQVVGPYGPLVDELSDSLENMNSNEYVLLELDIANQWNTLSSWVDEQPPHEMNYSGFLSKRYTTWRVPTSNLANYF